MISHRLFHSRLLYRFHKQHHSVSANFSFIGNYNDPVDHYFGAVVSCFIYRFLVRLDWLYYDHTCLLQSFGFGLNWSIFHKGIRDMISHGHPCEFYRLSMEIAIMNSIIALIREIFRPVSMSFSWSSAQIMSSLKSNSRRKEKNGCHMPKKLLRFHDSTWEYARI